MRTAAEFRARHLEWLSWLLTRPTMCASCAADMAHAGLGVLDDLCFIDEREHEMEAARSRLRERYPTALSVWEIQQWFPASPEQGFVAEVASIIAEVAVALGYHEVRRLTAEEWARLRLDDLSWLRGPDLLKPELEEWLPEPSMPVRGTDGELRASVYAFAPPEGAGGWVCFDFEEWGPDARLRDIRLPTARAADGVVLTSAGRAAVSWLPDSVLGFSRQA